MIILNDIGKIGIDVYVSMLGIKNISKEDVSGFKEEYCSKVNCSAYNHILNKAKTEEEKSRIKENMCAHCPYVDAKTKIASENEKHKYNIKTKPFPKSLSKQFLTYHLMCDSKGYIKNVSCSELAEELGVSERTIRNNNQYFIDNGIICLSKTDTDKFSLFILKYQDYFKTKKEYGKGYIQFTKEIYEELKNDTSIVNMRATGRLLLEQSKVNKYNESQTNNVILSLKNIENFLPSYINCPLKVKKILKSGSCNKIFNIDFKGNKITYNIKDNYDQKYIIDKHKETYTVNILLHINKLSRQIFGQGIDLLEITPMEDFIPDFVQMCQQYSLELVLDGITKLLIYIRDTNYQNNYGGYVRNKIEEVINRAM